MRVISASPMPWVVTDGLPTRMPDATLGGCGSLGMAFLLSTMPAASQRASASLPVTPVLARSSSARWVSVPPVTGRMPCSARPWVSAWAFVMTWRAYCWYSGVMHSLRLTALAATACMSGPPCIIGNTALSSLAACSALQTSAPPRGPRSTLCVVKVTTSA